MDNLLKSQKLRYLLSNLCFAACLFVISSKSIAQVNVQADSEESDITIEEITVTGQRSVNLLKLEAQGAAEKMYEMFNDLKSKEEFDVSCEYAFVTASSRVKRWGCDVQYMKDARAQDAYNFITFGTPIRNDNILSLELSEKTDALNTEMASLAQENPALREAMIEADELNQEYIQAREEKFKKSFLGGLFFGKPNSED